jgi:hypothetical protein
MDGLEKLLTELAKYGQVRMGQFGTNSSGWHCYMELFVPGEGVRMEVKSDHSSANMTPMEAATQCAERLQAILEGIKKQAPIEIPALGMRP